MRLQDQQDTAARPARTAPAVARSTDAAGPAAARRLLALQRAAGNAAVVQALERQRRAGPHPHGPSCGHDDPTPVQRHAHGPSCGHDESAPVQRSSVPDVLRTAGRPLDGAVRTEMEARLGADFSDVRLHTGAAAQRSAAEVGARAYTSGSHVVIGTGGADRHTLAHELTHVIQQRQGPVAGTDNGSGLSVSDPSDRFERAAEENARRVLAGPVPTGAAPVQRTAAAPAHSGGETAHSGGRSRPLRRGDRPLRRPLPPTPAGRPPTPAGRPPYSAPAAARRPSTTPSTTRRRTGRRRPRSSRSGWARTPSGIRRRSPRRAGP